MHLRDYLTDPDGRKLPAATFARRVGVTSATVHRWVDGSIVPSAEALRKIFKVTGGAVRPDDMVLTQVGDAA